MIRITAEDAARMPPPKIEKSPIKTTKANPKHEKSGTQKAQTFDEDSSKGSSGSSKKNFSNTWEHLDEKMKKKQSKKDPKSKHSLTRGREYSFNPRKLRDQANKDITALKQPKNATNSSTETNELDEDKERTEIIDRIIEMDLPSDNEEKLAISPQGKDIQGDKENPALKETPPGKAEHPKLYGAPPTPRKDTKNRHKPKNTPKAKTARKIHTSLDRTPIKRG